MRQVDVVRHDNEIRVSDGERIHVFKRPGLFTWAAFIDGAGAEQVGKASIALCRAVYVGDKVELNLLLRSQPALAMTLSGQFAEMLTEGIKIRKA